MRTDQIMNVAIGLSATPASQANFSVPMLLVDTDDVPIYRRYRTVSKSTFGTNLTDSTDHMSWCTTLWGQNYNPALAYIGRWVSAASSPKFICYSAVQTISVWSAISDGSCTVTTTAGADALTVLDFSSVTTVAMIAAVFDAALVAGGTSGARCAVDALGNIVFTDPVVTGVGADTVVISASGAGTHVELPAYLNVAAGFAEAGMDAETMTAALNAILALDNTPFAINERGGSIAEVLAFSTGVNAKSKILLLRVTDTDAKNPALSSDVGYQIEAVSHQKTHMTYTEHTTQNPDAAICGEILPKTEAKCDFHSVPLAGVSESGLHVDGTTVIPLTDDERIALEAKGYDYLVDPAGSVHHRHGLAAGGYEMRIMVGKMFMEAKVSEGVYGYRIANDVVTFSDDDIQAIKSIVIRWADILVDRKVLEAGYTVTMPSAEDFTAAAKATHVMDLDDISDAETQRSVHSVNITMSWSV